MGLSTPSAFLFLLIRTETSTERQNSWKLKFLPYPHDPCCSVTPFSKFHCLDDEANRLLSNLFNNLTIPLNSQLPFCLSNYLMSSITLSKIQGRKGEQFCQSLRLFLGTYTKTPTARPRRTPRAMSFLAET